VLVDRARYCLAEARRVLRLQGLSEQHWHRRRGVRAPGSDLGPQATSHPGLPPPRLPKPTRRSAGTLLPPCGARRGA
jgi:hypothetical protein